VKFGRKIPGLLLILALIASPLAATAWSDDAKLSSSVPALLSPAAPAQPAAACHAHDQTIPHSPDPRSPRPPAPSSYQCCLTGHDAALAQTPYSPVPLALSAVVVFQTDAGHTGPSPDDLSVTRVLSTDPPRKPQLRI